MNAYLGIDIGTTAIKALLMDENGHVAALASEEYEYTQPKTGWAEQDAQRWWELLGNVTRRVTAGSPHTVRAMALSTQGDTMVPVSADGQPLALARVWMDNRALPQVQAMNQLGREYWYQRTGSSPAAFCGTASVAWWRDETPDIYNNAACFCLVQDFLMKQLTGRFILDESNASRTMLFDIHTRCWSPELLAFCGIGPERLAETAPSGTICGTLLPHAAQHLGLSADVQVVLGGHDQTCAGVGCGVTRPGSALLSCGTAWVVLCATDGPFEDPGRTLHSYCHATPGGYVVLGAYAGGVLLRWFRDNYMENATGDAAYEAIMEEAVAAEAAGRSPLLFLPHFYGAAIPHASPHARGAWAGMTLGHTRGDMALALVRGVALQTAWVADTLTARGATLNEVRMIGGGARSSVWPQLVADALGLPITLPPVSEAASLGAAMLAAVADGAFTDLQEVTEQMPAGPVVSPRGDRDMALHQQFGDLLAALVPTWNDLAALQD